MVNKVDYEEIAKKLTDDGMLIEAGFMGLLAAAWPQGVSWEQQKEMRKVFMAGALHLFSSIMFVFDEGEDATDADLERMGMIHDELKRFGEQLTAELPQFGRMQ